MKRYFEVTFHWTSGDVYCVNLAHAESAADVRTRYEAKYDWVSVNEDDISEWRIMDAKRRGMPIVEI